MYRFCENLLQDKLIILHASLFINIGRAGRLKYYRTYLALSTCPDCGAQRALHAVPHPDIAEAIRYNLFHYRLQIVVFFFVSLPCKVGRPLFNWFNVLCFRPFANTFARTRERPIFSKQSPEGGGLHLPPRIWSDRYFKRNSYLPNPPRNA